MITKHFRLKIVDHNHFSNKPGKSLPINSLKSIKDKLQPRHSRSHKLSLLCEIKLTESLSRSSLGFDLHFSPANGLKKCIDLFLCKNLVTPLFRIANHTYFSFY